MKERERARKKAQTGKEEVKRQTQKKHTVCPRSSDPLYAVICCIKWITTSWTYSI